MTARQPRRTRRRNPAASLPRPSNDAEAMEGASAAQSRRTERRRPQRPQHHITTDYSYVRKDLLLVTAVTIVTMAFIAVMAFLAL